MPITLPPAQAQASSSRLSAYPSFPPSPPSPPSEAWSLDTEEEAALIQEEWEESLRQLEVVFSIVIMPFFGKWYGRRWAYWGERARGEERQG